MQFLPLEAYELWFYLVWIFLGYRQHYGYTSNMETVIRNIRELGGSQRSAAEHLVGHALREDQQLVMYSRTNGQLERKEIGPVRFVPLVGHHGWENNERR